MINNQELQRSILCDQFRYYLNEYCSTMDVNCTLEWDTRGTTQFVSNCFLTSNQSEMTPIVNVLNTSGMFASVKIFASRSEAGNSRIIINTEDVIALIDSFKHAHYFNALLKILPVSGVLCIPSSQSNQLVFQTCALNNSYEKIPSILNFLETPWEILPSSQIAISCTDVAKIIAKQKEICLDYLIQTITKCDSSIDIYTKVVNCNSIDSGHHGVKMSYSQDIWQATPAILFSMKTNRKALANIHAIQPMLVQFKENGYINDGWEDPIKTYGIKLSSVMNIPSFLKDLTWERIKTARNNYVATLLTFKSKSKDYGILDLPYELSKKLLSTVCDDRALLSKTEKDQLIDNIRNYKL